MHGIPRAPRRGRLTLSTLAAALTAALLIPAGASALTVSKAELRGGQLRIEGSGASPGTSVTAISQESGAFARVDAKGAFKLQASGFQSSTCTVIVSDGFTPIAQPTLSGCTPSVTPPGQNPPPSGSCVITPQAPATFSVGVLANFFMLTTGCDGTANQVQWTLAAGTLPPGMTGPISQGRTAGEVSGVPTTEGTFTFTVRASDSIGATDSETFTITIGPPAPLAITTATLPDATVGQGYAADLHASGGLPSYGWSIAAGALPPGLRISGIALNTIGGIPTRAGTYSFTVRATDSRGVSTTREETLTVH